VATLTFLGTGNYLAEGRYWNSFVLDGNVLVEPCPTALPHLRKVGIPAETIDAIVISHFHADHTFGWPFLLLEMLRRSPDRPLHVVGPPGVEGFLADMMKLGAVVGVYDDARAMLDIRYTEVDGTWQEAGPLRFRAIEVDHVPYLRCFGYLMDRAGRTIGYSGDTKPCAGLDELATESDAMVLECNGMHPSEHHMDIGAVKSLRERFPNVPFLLTHVGADVVVGGLPDVIIPNDFDVLEV
jgi:ribonuclease BN (tRNA processing enzyme)